MCKLGDKDYWQVGDKVYCQVYGKGVIERIQKPSARFPISVTFEKSINNHWFSLDGIFDADLPISLFHLGAITFDEYGRPTTINYDYVPGRTPKVMVTKLPHKFEEGEEVLGRDAITGNWLYHKFVKLSITDNFHPFKVCRVDKFFKHEVPTVIKYCIPYKGNEHCEGKSTDCKSGKIPDDYVFPKPKHVFKSFDKVLATNEMDTYGIFPWGIQLFSHMDKNTYVCMSGRYSKCIPFEGNEKLLGTTDNPEG